ncbi:expressed unknown protein [Seminavis robusta]|uniref:SnoaL-like domain-containing protein n=1 Tax=Seminavis robusta TaxID=568900 RepID=A0A9N8DCW2_9STRA|nr:expressed unknown protein [Seminavis robusta]|eukprot:Sro33_g021220.1 n/a (217) ;mRNA; r:14463-15113
MFKLFSGKRWSKTKTNGKALAKESQDGTSVCSNSNSLSNSNSSSSKKTRPKKATGTSTDNLNEELVAKYVAAVSAHASAEELLKHYASSTSRVLFDDTQAMDAGVMVTEIEKLYRSFNDMGFLYDSIKEIKPGVVLVENLQTTGTHTGPYTFANFPIVEATQKKIVLDPERCWFYMKDGKIDRVEITALGSLTGPPGMYLSVGGTMDMPPATPPGE